MSKKERYRLDCDLGKTLYTLVEGYSKVQGITAGSLLRRIVSDSFRNEIANINPNYSPKIVRRAKDDV